MILTEMHDEVISIPVTTSCRRLVVVREVVDELTLEISALADAPRTFLVMLDPNMHTTIDEGTVAGAALAGGTAIDVADVVPEHIRGDTSFRPGILQLSDRARSTGNFAELHRSPTERAVDTWWDDEWLVVSFSRLDDGLEVGLVLGDGAAMDRKVAMVMDDDSTGHGRRGQREERKERGTVRPHIETGVRNEMKLEKKGKR